MSRTTGLSLVSIEEDCVHVQLRQEVPLSFNPMQGGELGAVRLRAGVHNRVCVYVCAWRSGRGGEGDKVEDEGVGRYGG